MLAPLAKTGWTSVRVASNELISLARQAWLMRHDAREPVIPRGVAAGHDVVVFLHGFLTTAGVLRPMRLGLARHASVPTATLSFPVGPGVEELAGQLAALLDRVGASVRLHLVGHSLGGVVARHYAITRGDERVVQTISLASPFAGVPGARLLRTPFGRDLDPSSAVLERLAHAARAPGALPHLSIIAANDVVVPQPLSQALAGGDVLVVPECGHNRVLYDRAARRHVTERVMAHLGRKSRMA